MLTSRIRKYFILLSMTSKVIKGHKRSHLLTMTYVLMDNFCPCFYINIRKKFNSKKIL